jgi:hypothetical protein
VGGARRWRGHGPSLIKIEHIKGINERTKDEVLRDSSNTKPFSALTFKVTTNPFFGTLNFTSASTLVSCEPSVTLSILR